MPHAPWARCPGGYVTVGHNGLLVVVGLWCSHASEPARPRAIRRAAGAALSVEVAVSSREGKQEEGEAATARLSFSGR